MFSSRRGAASSSACLHYCPSRLGRAEAFLPLRLLISLLLALCSKGGNFSGVLFGTLLEKVSLFRRREGRKLLRLLLTCLRSQSTRDSQRIQSLHAERRHHIHPSVSTQPRDVFTYDRKDRLPSQAHVSLTEEDPSPRALNGRASDHRTD